jgi:hypothetical protein
VYRNTHEENYRWRSSSCFPENLSNRPLRLPNIFVEQLTHCVRKTSSSNCELTSGPFTAMKFSPLSVAKAFAVIVLLHPGGPYNKTPLGASTPNLLKVSPCVNGHSTHSLSLAFTSSWPPMSDHRTVGVSTKTSRIAEGRTVGRIARISALVNVGAAGRGVQMCHL